MAAMVDPSTSCHTLPIQIRVAKMRLVIPTCP
jgi:hypothetical protein